MFASLNAASRSLKAISLPTIPLPATTLLTRLVTPIINISDYVLGLLRATFSYPPMPLLCEFDAEDQDMGITLCAGHVTAHSSVLAMQDYDNLEDEMEERMRVRRGAYTVKIDETGCLRM